MLRPERMSRVSVTGSKAVMADAIDALHELRLLHLSDYDGAWTGFDNGNPIEGADEAAEKLVTVRALESILGIEDDDAVPGYRLDHDELDERLEEVRVEVNELDDRRDEIREELRRVRDRIDAMRPFARLGIDLSLLDGYDAIEVAVGSGREGEIREALETAESVRAHEVFTGDGVIAVAVAPAGDREPEAALNDALVGVAFERFEVPDADENPATHVDRLNNERQRLQSQLETVESELADLKLDVAGFLLAAEEALSIEVEQNEAPLRFATTRRSFVAEGWIPTDEYRHLDEQLTTTLDDRVEVEELERADYRDSEFVGGHGEHEPHDAGAGEPTAADGGEADATEARADGGHADAAMADDGPPIRQDNPGLVKPFELLTQAVGRPKYTELDPTVILFLTFPLMFGFMIGDFGYGVIYTAIGYWVYTNFDSDTFKSFGGVTIAAGLFTVLFGILYGEIFGLHMSTLPVTGDIYPHPVIEKGLSPATEMWAQAWFVVTALFGVVHLNIAYIFEFVEEYTFHGARAAVEETGSWILALNGLWVFVFSRLFSGQKPELLFTVFDTGEAAAFELGFSGLPVWTGWAGLGLVVVGLGLLAIGPTHELVEAHQVLAHVLSYLRIGAVLLAKAGMAFAVNLLFFGAYRHHGEYHFMLSYGPHYVADHYPEAEIMFDGMMHGGPAAVVGGVLVLLVGHLVVLALGVTSAGIQGVRLEYFEFFSKFYEDGGDAYDPFGYERTYTAER